MPNQTSDRMTIDRMTIDAGAMSELEAHRLARLIAEGLPLIDIRSPKVEIENQGGGSDALAQAILAQLAAQ